MALTAGAYAWPEHPRPVAAAVAALLTYVNYRGIAKTARVTRVLVVVTLAALLLVVAGALGGGAAAVDRLSPAGGSGPYGVLQAAGLLFFAFAGYARITTLGEEVRDPARTIPRAVPLALGVVVLVYAVVAVSALLVLGPSRLAGSTAPLSDVVRAGSWEALAPAVRVGAVAASCGVLLSLLAGVGRTVLAMARDGELPRPLAAVHARHRVPHRAELLVGGLVVVTVLAADVRGAIGFSSLGVLVYYAVANASAYTLRRSLRPVAAVGLVGCLTLAATLPATSVVAGVAVLAVGLVARYSRLMGPNGHASLTGVER
jgi:APA family basic amino acid/polyamine antiporter